MDLQGLFLLLPVLGFLGGFAMLWFTADQLGLRLRLRLNQPVSLEPPKGVFAILFYLMLARHGYGEFREIRSAFKHDPASAKLISERLQIKSWQEVSALGLLIVSTIFLINVVLVAWEIFTQHGIG